MKKTMMKFSCLVVGASLVLASCIKTEESAEIKDLRKARAAREWSLANNQNIKNATDSLTLLIAKSKFGIDTAAAKVAAEKLLQTAQKDLITAQIDHEKAIRLQQIDANSNTVLLALLKDYDAYYNGGSLSDGSNIANGIFDLQSENLSYQSDLIDLNYDKNQVVTLKKQKQLDSIVAQKDIKNETALLVIFQNAKTGSLYEDAVTSAQNLLNTSRATQENLQLSFDKIVNEADAANQDYTNANTLWSNRETEKANALTVMNTLKGIYGSYEEMQIAKTNANSDVSSTGVVLGKWQIAYNDAQSKYSSSYSSYKIKEKDKQAADAAVEIAQINNDPKLGDYLTAQGAANTAFSDAQTDLNDKELIFNSTKTSFENAKTASENAITAYNDISKDIEDYKNVQNIYNIANSLIPDLKTAKDQKLAILNVKSHNKDSINVLLNNAIDITSTNADAVDALINDLNSIDNLIKNTQENVNSLIDDLDKINNSLALLNQGYNTATGQYVNEVIKEKQDQIAINNTLIAKYEAKANALKIKITVQ